LAIPPRLYCFGWGVRPVSRGLPRRRDEMDNCDMQDTVGVAYRPRVGCPRT